MKKSKFEILLDEFRIFKKSGIGFTKEAEKAFNDYWDWLDDIEEPDVIINNTKLELYEIVEIQRALRKNLREVWNLHKLNKEDVSEYNNEITSVLIHHVKVLNLLSINK